MEFRRDAGEGGAAQRWIDSNLPRCPLCRTETPWEVGVDPEDAPQSRWAFRCSNCKAVLSMTPADIAVQAIAEPSIVANPAIERNIRVMSVERSQDEDFVGEEFPLTELQELASEDEEDEEEK